MDKIPHIIHYCWFGKSVKPRSVKKYIKNWHKMLPDYQFMEWNESNCNLENEIPYVKEAYQAKKYAFVSDYIRIKKLNEYGGIYLDTDVKVLKCFGEFLKEDKMVLSFQGKNNINTAFIASVAQHPLLQEFLKDYGKRHFKLSDGRYDTTSINVKMDPLLEHYGIKFGNDSFQRGDSGIVVYPTEYLSAFNVQNWRPAITENTYTVHFMASSWRPKSLRMKALIFKFLFLILGQEKYDKLHESIKKRK